MLERKGRLSFSVAVDAWIRGVRRFAATDAGEQARERRIRRLLDAALADAAED